MDKRLKIACWIVGLGFVAVAAGWATFEQWAGLVGMMFGQFGAA